MKKYYLAYGSNLNLEQMAIRCPNSLAVGTFELANHRLVYKGSMDGFAYLTIEENQGSNVPLGVFEVSIFDIKFLDRYEGYPTLYSKKYIPIKINGKTKKALIYVMNEEFDYHIPSKEYIETCKTGYNDFGFDVSVLNKALNDTIENLPKRLVKKQKQLEEMKTK